MLKIYEQLFLKLNYESISYCIYKGLNHLEEDLDGKRGDIDLLVSYSSLDNFEFIVKELGFNRVKNSFNLPRYYMSRDEETGAFVMLDVDSDIRLGNNPNRPINFSIDLDNLVLKSLIVDTVSITILDTYDYVPLMLLMRITSQNPSVENFEEIKSLHSQHEKIMFNTSYFGTLTNKINPKILKFKETSWNILQNSYKNEILNFFAGGVVKRKLKSGYINICVMVKETLRRIKRLLGRPAAFAHKGYMVAFVGVDGAGKSSAIDCVLSDSYFQTTGLKRIYFGGNEFIIPGTLKLYQWLVATPSIRWLRVFPSFLMQMDRRIRLLKALYFKAMGNIVLCDRYYYDDELMREYLKKRITEKNSSILLDKLQLFLIPRVLVKPDLTFYLDVSPEVAYQRKQDFSFETMIKVNKDYRDLMSTKEEVTFINADEEQMKVQSSILKQIKYLSDRRNEYDS